ncbi:mCG147862 [Mus musculus]|nr:mCG147862 [Mus musculus]
MNSAWNLILQPQGFCCSHHFSSANPPQPPVHCTPLFLYGRKRSRHTKKGPNTHRHGKYFLCLLLGPDKLQERKST